MTRNIFLALLLLGLSLILPLGCIYTASASAPATQPRPRLQIRLVAPPNDNTTPAEEFPDPADPANILRVTKPVLLDESALASAAFSDAPSYFAINIALNPPAAAQMYKITTGHRTEKLAMIVDGKLLSAPTIQAAISNEAVITFPRTANRIQAQAIAAVLQSLAAKNQQVIPAQQTDLLPDANAFYYLFPNDIYKANVPGPAEMDNSKAWTMANEFVYRTALRKSYKLPASSSGPQGDGYVMGFTTLAGGEELRVFVSKDFNLVKRLAPASPATRAGGILPEDMAALRTVLQQHKVLAGWKMEQREGAVTPFGLVSGTGVELSFPPVDAAGKFVPLTLWIMAGDYSAAPAPPSTGPRTPLPGQPRELARWNGHRVFIYDVFDAKDKSWPNASADIEAALKATGGPLAAAAVLRTVEGKETLQLELWNRSDKAVKVYSGGATEVAGTPVSPFFWEGSWEDVRGDDPLAGYAAISQVVGPPHLMTDAWTPNLTRMSPEEVRVLQPGERLHWVIGRINIHVIQQKWDVQYVVEDDDPYPLEAAGSKSGVWKGHVAAPAVRVTVGLDGRAVLKPWVPQELTAAESAASARVEAGLGKWVDGLKAQLEEIVAAAGGERAEAKAYTYPTEMGQRIRASCVLGHNFKIGLMDDISRKDFSGFPPVMSVQVRVERAGELHGLELAERRVVWGGGLKWDREHQVPGTDVVVFLTVGGNMPELMKKAYAILDDAYSQLVQMAQQESAIPPPLPAPKN